MATLIIGIIILTAGIYSAYFGFSMNAQSFESIKNALAKVKFFPANFRLENLRAGMAFGGILLITAGVIMIIIGIVALVNKARNK